MPELTKTEINQRLIKLRNLERLYPAAKAKIEILEKSNKRLKEKVNQLINLIQVQSDVIEKLKLRVEELEKMIFSRKNKDKQDKDNPVQANYSIKPKLPRNPTSYQRTIPQDNEITKIVNYSIKSCPNCQTKLKNLKTVIRYQEDIKLEALKKIEKQNIETGYCVQCKKQISAKEISKAKVSLGENIRQLTTYSSVILRLSYEQTRHLLKGLADISLSDGEISRILEEQANRLSSHYHQLINNIRGQPGVHYDETGYPVQSEEQGRFGWVMTGTENEETVFRLGQSRGKGNVLKLRGKNNRQAAITDDYGAYRNTFKYHQLCWAHVLRKLRDLKDSNSLAEKKRKHAQKMYSFCQALFIRLKNELEKPYSPKQREKTRQRMIKKLEKIVKDNKDDCSKLKTIKQNLIKNKDKYFTALLFRETIPLTNNKAERALRHLVLKRKNSYGSRTQKGANIMSILYSVLLSLWWSKPDNFFGEYRKLVYGE